ncbi:MAG: hypothetical protein HC810_07510 [Acaryochloridaceae cyanobacterium RL_2_7]|nr:hypothetical protein [Acaryochloridaceae cyanobacterium RL_2_7]
MVRFKSALAVTALGLMTLTACGEQVKEATDTAGEVTGAVTDKAGEVTGEVTDKAGEVTGAVTDTVDGAKDKMGELTGLATGLPAFKDSAAAALEAVQGGDFETAKTEVTKLQEAWTGIADQVKEKAPDAHTKIEEGLGSLTSGLEGDSPDGAQLSTTIQDMVASLSSVEP